MALAIAVGLGDTAGLAAQIAQGAVAGTTAEVVIGTLQWLVPRTRFSAARWWVAASVGGLDLVIAPIVAASVTGIALAAFLRSREDDASDDRGGLDGGAIPARTGARPLRQGGPPEAALIPLPLALSRPGGLSMPARVQAMQFEQAIVRPRFRLADPATCFCSPGIGTTGRLEATPQLPSLYPPPGSFTIRERSGPLSVVLVDAATSSGALKPSGK